MLDDSVLGLTSADAGSMGGWTTFRAASGSKPRPSPTGTSAPAYEATSLPRPASFCGLHLVHVVSTWLPQLIGARADSGNESRGLTAFALARLVGELAVTLVPLARRAASAAVLLAAGASHRPADYLRWAASRMGAFAAPYPR